MSSYVYFISDGANTKIGKANDVETRLSQLQTGSSSKLTVIRTIEYATEFEALSMESYYHIKFKEKNILNEWFNLTLDDIPTCDLIEEQVDIWLTDPALVRAMLTKIAIERVLTPLVEEVPKQITVYPRGVDEALLFQSINNHLGESKTEIKHSVAADLGVGVNKALTAVNTAIETGKFKLESIGEKNKQIVVLP